MNILLVTPGISKKYNDNFHAYDCMALSGNNILAISQRQNFNKGFGQEPELSFEKFKGFEIYRLFDNLKQLKSLIHHQLKFNKIITILNNFKPDIIFVEEITCLPLALKIKKKFNIPLILRVEFAFDETKPYQTFGNKLKLFKSKIFGDSLAIFIGRLIWNWACKNVDSLITCYYEDSFRKISSKPALLTYYVPWPTYFSEDINEKLERDNYGLFIGSFDKHKNIKELLETIPLIFDKTKTEKFYIIGAGYDLSVVNYLKCLYPDKIVHILSLSRNECLKLIKSAFFSYSPAVKGGWGFIGDSWAASTPVIVTHNHYGFKDGEDSIVTDPSKIADRINQLYDLKYFKMISLGGYLRYKNEHSASTVGDKYLSICSSLINLK